MIMRSLRIVAFVTASGLFAGIQAFAQSTSDQQQNGGNAAGAEKQKTQGSPTIVGPGSKAYRQNTQGSPPMIGPGSKAYKQNTQATPSQDAAK
jgi:hypothetical protein